MEHKVEHDFSHARKVYFAGYRSETRRWQARGEQTKNKTTENHWPR